MHRMVRDLLCVCGVECCCCCCFDDSRCMEKPEENITQNGNSKTKRRKICKLEIIHFLTWNQTELNQIKPKPKPKTKAVGCIWYACKKWTKEKLNLIELNFNATTATEVLAISIKSSLKLSFVRCFVFQVPWVGMCVWGAHCTWARLFFQKC